MKTCCKNVCLTDASLIERGIWKALSGKYSRCNYISFLASYGLLTIKELKKLAADTKYHVITPQERKEALYPTVKLIVADVQNQISAHNLVFDPVQYEERFDKGTEKWRVLGIESPMQQILEHVACLALYELWHNKIAPHQYSSLDKRGQLKGAVRISRWIRRKLIRFFVKLDIRKCFDNIRHEDIIRLLRRDVGKNKELIWFVSELLKHHNDGIKGLIVGSWLSSLLCNYMLSYAYRYVCSLYSTRRGKTQHYIKRALFFMDDILLVGTNVKNMKLAIKELSAYLEKEYGLIIKGNWCIKEISKEPITMMGFTVFGDGKVKIRRKNFVKIRRSFIVSYKGCETIKQARRCTAYYGYSKHTDTQDVWSLKHEESVNVKIAKNKACKYQSDYDKEKVDRYVKQNRILTET